jgi:hypothetical protein
VGCTAIGCWFHYGQVIKTKKDELIGITINW